jgi:hypothetical protein
MYVQAQNITTARQLLDLIREFMNSVSELSSQKSQLWDIITAFRAADTESNYDLKRLYTQPIRRLVLGNWAGDSGSPVPVNSPTSGPAHWISHISFALAALRRQGYLDAQLDKPVPPGAVTASRYYA